MTRPPQTMPRIARALTAILLPLPSVLLVLGIFELGLRLTGHGAIYEIYSKPSLFWRYDALLGWSHEPNAHGEFVGPRPWPIEFRGNIAINSLGLRGPEIPPRAPGERRVLFVGDSFVASFEVDYDVTFAAQIEQLLRSRLGSPVRAINAGVRGYGTDQEYLYFRERGWLLQPDVVVLFYSGNDPSDNTTLHEMRRPFGKPAFSLHSDGSLSLLGSPVPPYPTCSEVMLTSDYEARREDSAMGRMLCRAQTMLFDHSALFSYLTLAIPWNYDFLKVLYYVGNPHAEQLARAAENDLPATSEGRLTTSIVIALYDEVRRRGANFVLVGYPKHLRQIDLEAVKEHAIPVVPLAAIEEHELDLRWHHDGHLNPEGHRWVSEILVDEIAAQLRKPASGSNGAVDRASLRAP